MKAFFRINPDTAGFFTSMLCAIHCSAVPIWLHNHMIDWVVIGSGIVIASYSLVGDYFNRHRQIVPGLTALFGFSFLLIGMIDHHGWMLIFSVLGGLMVATAHMLNHRLTRLSFVKG